MKMFLFKTHLAVLVLLGVFAFGFGPTQASAQLLDPTGIFASGGDVPNLVAPAQAITILTQEVSALDAQIVGAPSEPLKYKRKFYTCILETVQLTSDVAGAIDGSFVRFVPGYVDKPVEFPNTLGTPVWNGYYNEVVQLLMN